MNTFGALAIAFSTVFCGPSNGLQSWEYTYSGNEKNGIADRQGYIKLVFEPTRDRDGTIHQVISTLPLAGFAWDRSFRHLMFSGTSPVICGERHWYGQTRDERACELQGSFAPERVDACGERGATRFSGAIHIRE